MYKKVVEYIKDLYPKKSVIPLHEPLFIGNEKKYLLECIDSTFVSYLGPFVTKFEDQVKEFTGAKYAIAITNGTLALHLSLLLLGVTSEDEVLIPALSFIATANAVAYCGAKPVFVDSEITTFGMSPETLNEFLCKNVRMKKDGNCYNRLTGRRIAACIPVHIFGHPCKINEIKAICDNYNIPIVEDAAESLGSLYKNTHTGLFGRLGILSFNGNKTITTGGGGMIVTNDEDMAIRARHLSTTAKIPHKWEFVHDEIGYNYRLPNVNAAIGCAQMENLTKYLKNKRELAKIYKTFFEKIGISFLEETNNCRSNYWLNAIIMKDKAERDHFLKYSNDNGVMTRPIWRLLNQLKMFRKCQTTNLKVAKWLEARVVNIPSSVRN